MLLSGKNNIQLQSELSCCTFCVEKLSFFGISLYIIGKHSQKHIVMMFILNIYILNYTKNTCEHQLQGHQNR